jgi:Domain of unknown function (DUF1877)
MGQIAVLSRLNKVQYDLAKENYKNFVVNDNKIQSTIFEQTQEGLKFILEQIFENQTLISEIFYPQQFLGEIIGNSNDDDFDYGQYEELICYLPPNKILTINQLLQTVDNNVFTQNFMPEKMNDAKIYPWNWGTNQYDLEHTLREFEKLKLFFQTAAFEENYIISYIGY